MEKQKVKFLIRKTKDNSFVDMQTVSEEYIHEYQEIENLEERQGYYIETYYDKEEDMIKQRYIEIAKTETEILKEELEKTNRALEDLILQNAML